MADVKITKKDRFNELLAIEAVAQNEELVAFIKREIELLSKKRSSSKKVNEANEALKTEILNVLEGSKPLKVTEILAKGDFSADTSNQKITAMLRQLVAEEKVEKFVDKKVSLYGLPGSEVIEESEGVEEN
jgi:hypothetical protein